MYLTQVYPRPVSFVEKECSPYPFGASAILKLTSPIKPEAAEGIRFLWNRFSFTASELTIEQADCPQKGWTAVLGAPDFDEPKTDYYAISSNESGAIVSAVSEEALVNGLKTLVQLITPVSLGVGEEKLTLCPVEIADKPSMQFRSIHLCLFPESDVSTIEKAIELGGLLKLTHVVLEFWGIYPFETMKELGWAGHCWKKEQVRALVDLCHLYNMEVIPMFNMLGHASQSRGGMGRHSVLNQNPRLQLYFEPDGWTWCVSNPDTQKLMADLIEELCELCGSGSYFHIGCDEADSFATCPICKRQAHGELLAEHIRRLTDRLGALGRRPIMWHDQLIRRRDFASATDCSVVANGDDTYRALDLIDRRVIIADWQYGYVNEKNPTTPYFMEKGFDTILCPWDNLNNILSLSESARRLNAYGVMLTTWHHLPAFTRRLYEAANMLWCDCSSGYPKTGHNDAAAILRKVHASPRFEESGWNKIEVEQ